MMPLSLACSKEAALRLFYNSSSFFLLFFLFSYSSSILLSKLFHFFHCADPIPQGVIDHQDGLEFEGEQVDQYFYEEDHLVADDTIDAGQDIVFSPQNRGGIYIDDEVSRNGLEQQQPPFNELYPDNQYDDFTGRSQWPPPPPSARSSPETEWLDMEDSFHDEDRAQMLNEEGTPIIDSTIIDHDHQDKSKSGSLTQRPRSQEEMKASVEEMKKGGGSDEKHEIKEGDVFGDSCTVGSTSKSSSDWRSSNISNRDSGTDDPFSSSSRTSCPNWESYTIFQKYDEERMFLDRLCVQKLHETESLRCIQACPRSISERVVHKLAIRNKTASTKGHNKVCHHDSLRELEATYVAQVCLTWEALNWNYKNFRSKISAGLDPGCPAGVAQRFQQFQVMLQRYIENEPYEHGRRPEVYAKMRKITPMLLLVPEYCEDSSEQYEHIEEGFAGSRISSASFLKILEDGIRTFMNFLKADRENCCKVLIQSFFNKKRSSSSVDPTLISLYKKVNKKKRAKLENIRRGNGKCFRKRRLNEGVEMETLMGLIDLKLVSRVLRMADLSDEQLQWCETKMRKVRISEGRLQRDSSPLFFPAHMHNS